MIILFYIFGLLFTRPSVGYLTCGVSVLWFVLKVYICILFIIFTASSLNFTLLMHPMHLSRLWRCLVYSQSLDGSLQH
ncbi:Orf21 [Heliothis zea nudivirus]|uniref:Orf21 n=1 Tax=Heliothis zea nudivirus 1 TaxID=3116536 RepID=Q8JKU0_9VIRU|nr:Orf21 [Heliothis zea nudivirus]AAN04316.1 Orf21 [Heliothis zea nudivirus]